VARLSAADAEAGGRMPPWRTAALCCAALVAGVAVPPWLAVLESAGARTHGRPARAHRSARQVPGEEAVAAADQVGPSGRPSLEPRLWAGGPMPVGEALALVVQEAEGQGAGLPGEATSPRVRRRVEAPEGSASPAVVVPSPSRPRGRRRRGPPSVSRMCRRRLTAYATLRLSAAPETWRSTENST
jgi:hypothetical protein